MSHFVAKTAAGALSAAAIAAPTAGLANAQEAPAPTPAPEPKQPVAQQPACEPSAKACVDLANQTAWLQDGNGNITYGPVPIASGMVGSETPTGVQTVSRKIANEWSRTFNAPMPNSVYFGPNGNDNGIAFHADNVNVKSNGCVHLTYDASQQFFDYLQPGDIVHVF